MGHLHFLLGLDFQKLNTLKGVKELIIPITSFKRNRN